MAQIQKRMTKAGKARYTMRVFVGRDPDTGARKFITKTFDRRKDALAEATRLERNKHQGVLISPSKETLARYLLRWFEDVKEGSLRGRTASDYRGVLRRYIEDPPDGTPNIGRIALDRLTVEDVQAFYTSLRKDQGLSPATIRTVHAIIRPALRYAMKTGAVARNVADLVELPEMQKRKVVAMSKEEAEGFLRAARDDRYYALWCVLLTGGLRPGEALALQWDDLDVDAAKLHIQRALTRRGVEGPWALTQPKTSRGRRVVVLPDFAVRALRAHRKTQAEERLRLAAEYENHGFVFATKFGQPLRTSTLYRRNFRRIMEAAGLGRVTKVETAKGKQKNKFTPKYRLYDLRHTAATLLLRAGENPKVVSERLGHASVAFTMDVYAASLPDLQEGAAQKMETLFGESA